MIAIFICMIIINYAITISLCQYLKDREHELKIENDRKRHLNSHREKLYKSALTMARITNKSVLKSFKL